TIELLNTWTNFVRSFYLSCCLNAKPEFSPRIGVTGLPLRTAEVLAIDTAIQITKPSLYLKHTPGAPWSRRDEPSWHDPRTLLKLSQSLGFSNEADIQAAVSINPRVLLDLPVFRNFFAHRNRDTFLSAQRLASHYGI